MTHPAGAPRKAKLTNQLVRRLPAQKGQYFVRDTDLAGFFVVVGAKAKTYTIQCDVRTLGGRRSVRQVIGRADVWDAGEARKEAKAQLGNLQTGATRATPKRGALTLREAWADLEKHLVEMVESGERSARTVEGYSDCIERRLKSWLDTPLRDLSESPLDVKKKHAELTRTQGAYAANHAMGALRAVYNHAKKYELDRGMPEGNPVRSLKFNSEKRRSTGMALKDLPGWLAQLRALGNPVREEFHLFCLLSASRPDALKRARWEHLDPKRRTLHFPDPKGGTKKAFDMPLSREMLRCLCRARRGGRKLYPVAAQEWIFPANTESGHLVEHKEKRTRLSKWGGDLRQTWRTAGATVGLSDLDAHLLMNHSLGSVNAGYITTGALLDHLTAQQETMSRTLMGALNGKDEP